MKLHNVFFALVFVLLIFLIGQHFSKHGFHFDTNIVILMVSLASLLMSRIKPKDSN